jgi:hypothetical protein
MTSDRHDTIGAAHVAVLLDPDRPRDIIDMPERLGRWVKVPAFKRRLSNGWRFELSEDGRSLAVEAKRLSDAANESMREYLQGERANCFPGAFRDGFARGVGWGNSLPRTVLTRLFVWGWCVCDVENGEGIDCILPTLGEAESYADKTYGTKDATGHRVGVDGYIEFIEIFPGLCLRSVEGESRVHKLLGDEIEALGVCDALRSERESP